LWSDAFSRGSNRRVSFILKKGMEVAGLQKPLGDITLLQVFHAIGSTELFSIGWATEHDKCQIEDAVNNEISDTLEEARRLITNRFAELTLDKLVPEVLKHK